MQEFTFMRKEDGAPIVLGRVFTTITEPDRVAPSRLLTVAEAEDMKLQELERGVSSLCITLDKMTHRLDDLKSQMDIFLKRIEQQDEIIANLNQDIQEWQLKTEPIEERA